MTVIATDSDGAWTFDAARELYRRSNEAGINALIYGKYLPNPTTIRQETGRKVAPVTQALWEHWNAYNNN